MSDEALRQAVASEIRHRDTLGIADMDTSPGQSGKRTEILSKKMGRPFALRNGAPADLAIMAYEEKTAAGAAPETFNLAHDLVESGATTEDIIVYVNDTLTEPATVDYDADTVDVDTAADDTVGIFYASGKQARVEVQKTAPNGTTEPLWSGDVKLLHMRDSNKDPVTFELAASFWESIIPTDWTLSVYITAPYIARFEKDVGGDGNAESATNALVGLPVLGGTGKIDGLGSRVRQDAAER